MTDWRTRALCREHENADLWFPVGTSGPALVQAAQAKAVCGRCPVMGPCRDFALAMLPYGVAGGMDEDERRDVIERRAMARLDERGPAEQLGLPMAEVTAS